VIDLTKKLMTFHSTVQSYTNFAKKFQRSYSMGLVVVLNV
jgi:hypothetical protein